LDEESGIIEVSLAPATGTMVRSVREQTGVAAVRGVG